VVDIQKPTQSLATNDSSRPSRILVTTVDQVIVESLMVPFLMIVLRVLEDRTPKMGLAQRNQTVQAFGLDRKPSPLTEIDPGAAHVN